MEAHAECEVSVEETVEPLLSLAEMDDIVNYVLGAEAVERPCLVSISIVSDERIAELNREWRAIDRATDVISLECERPDDPDLAENEPCELGDIILAPAYITCQAQEHKTTPEDECRLLLVHGLLHLLGYDHIQEEEAQIMEAREDELLKELALDKSLAAVTLTRHNDGD